MDNRFFQEPNTKEDIPVLKHKRLDLRHQEDFRKFFAKKFVFQVNTPKPINIVVHSNTSNQESEYIHSTIEDIIREGFRTTSTEWCKQSSPHSNLFACFRVRPRFHYECCG